MMSSLAQVRQTGMTLIEVLVTLVLVSVGLLGVAGLQLASLKTNQEAYARSQASVLAADILDRMRANGVNFRKYIVAANGTGEAATTAGNDLLAWQAAIDRTLGGDPASTGGQIDVGAAPSNVVTITIRWSERGRVEGGQTIAAQPITFRTRTEI
jgi:type IV pilus assembly protein PilV